MREISDKNSRPSARETYGREIHLKLFLEVDIISIRDRVAAASRVVTLDFGQDSCIADGQDCQ